MCNALFRDPKAAKRLTTKKHRMPKKTWRRGKRLRHQLQLHAEGGGFAVALLSIVGSGQAEKPTGTLR
jgi:hypothetical protein